MKRITLSEARKRKDVLTISAQQPVFTLVIYRDYTYTLSTFNNSIIIERMDEDQSISQPDRHIQLKNYNYLLFEQEYRSFYKIDFGDKLCFLKEW